MDAALTDAFEANRPRLKRLAYRMLGSVSEAEDAVQDAWIRWQRAGEGVTDPAAWLVRATTRLCIDRLRAAKVERDAYKGPWLPEPLIEPMTDDPVEKAEEVSIAFLLALERLSPLERAVFLLHDVFDQDYAEVAGTLERSESAVRQLASRAREHVQDARPRFAVDQDKAMKLAAAFMAATATADFKGLASLLAEDAIMVSDGGGKRKAALRVMVGREDIVGLMQGIAWRNGAQSMSDFAPARVNGLPGFIMQLSDGPSVMAFETGEDGKIAAVYVVRNPDKLTHVK
ncbi:MAG: RNA polymerase sigma factor SigJ [Alphaproteobacteria bacterium]|nr:RNA polymerase sigma factor SigJ [Alphaproteobacteria bacterium]MBU1513498.1 RNA polymerase sigma factor SigJ [Alphaproteobacteria bacterium]MBU2096490.1 RNA polymerase sigma factor SigJ [Alphaproteobacteria bacterium]MBU2149818.1 RNA polymerase sigma factor SigJ [Alphaproteobacteria bacterium]MBU2305207.1 RNA polymerase sigma factor SigJ [Alphaproteobacteria bacterium]